MDERLERMDVAFDRADWIATPAAEALLRNNQPLLAYAAGRPGAFTSKDHNFRPGETVEKQIIVINNSRESVTCDVAWSLDLPAAISGRQTVTVPTGEQARIPLRFALPTALAAGRHEIRMSAGFGDGGSQEDRFAIDLLQSNQPRSGPPSRAHVALFDPMGETSALLANLGLHAQNITADADLSPFEMLVLGKGALKTDGAAPDVLRLREGLKVLVFEQTSTALKQRLGFRVQEYGLRQVFPRVPDHPVLAGVPAGSLRDWRGAAILLSPRLKYEMRPRHGPTVQWAGIPVTRVWRCGNRGNVASVLMEKPARGDFLPLLDGGFGLQFSPLMEYSEGRGVVLFCQLDVTGRIEVDPAAEALVRNIWRHLLDWKPKPRRGVVYAGEPDGRTHLESMGLTVRAYTDAPGSRDEVRVVGPGGGRAPAQAGTPKGAVLHSGAHVLGLGLDQDDVTALLPFPVIVRKGEHISSFFRPAGTGSLLAGIGPASVQIRDPRDLPLFVSGVARVGDGVLATVEKTNVIFMQMPPWQFSGGPQPNLRRTFRHTSVLLSRLLANMGAAGRTPLLERFAQPVNAARAEQRWLGGLYLDHPEEWDDPYRFFRW